MKRATAVLILLLLAGCQSVPSGNTTVIAPHSSGEPQIKWVKRGNVYYLEMNPAATRP